MNRTAAIMICDRENLFRETLMNYLLAAGYTEIELAANVRAALRLLHAKRFSAILIGVHHPPTLARRLRFVVRRLQPGARIVCLKRVWLQRLEAHECDEVLLKERVYESLLDTLARAAIFDEAQSKF